MARFGPTNMAMKQRSGDGPLFFCSIFARRGRPPFQPWRDRTRSNADQL